MTTEPTKEMIALARKIAAETQDIAALRKYYLDGTRDNEIHVRIALAAIQATRTEFIHSLRHNFDDWPDYVALADVADALEADHLKETPDV